MSDANDAIFKDVNATIVEQPYVEDKDPLAITSDPGRINQQQILQSAVKGRLMRPLDDFNSIALIASDVATGRSIIVNTITTNNRGGLVTQEVYYQVYIGNYANSDTRMPDVISSANYPFYVWNALYEPISGTALNSLTNKTVTKIQVRNNSSVTQGIWVQIYTRYIANGTNTTSPV